MYGAGQLARGRQTVEDAVMAAGLTVVDQQIVELYSAGHRVTVAGTNTYRQDSTGKTAGLSLAAACSSAAPPPDAVQLLKSGGFRQMAIPGYTVAARCRVLHRVRSGRRGRFDYGLHGFPMAGCPRPGWQSSGSAATILMCGAVA